MRTIERAPVTPGPNNPLDLPVAVVVHALLSKLMVFDVPDGVYDSETIPHQSPSVIRDARSASGRGLDQLERTSEQITIVPGPLPGCSVLGHQGRR